MATSPDAPPHIAHEWAALSSSEKADVLRWFAANGLALAWKQGRESIGLDMTRPIGPDGQRPTTPNPYEPVVT